MTVNNKACFFEIALDGLKIGKIWIELFDKITPKTCQNFRTLCKKENSSFSSSSEPDMNDVNGYKGCILHRVIKGFMIQGGDTDHLDGRGGKSIYGEKFEDENFEKTHDRAGLLSMANAGPNTNGSQFFITTAPAKHLDGKHVVFGKVIQGMSVVRKIEKLETGPNDKPTVTVEIVECGEGDFVPVNETQQNSDGDIYEDFPEDLDLDDLDDAKRITTLLDAAAGIKNVGNSYFSKNENKTAIEKYEKAVRYLDAIHPSPEDLTEMTLDQKKSFFKLKTSSLLNSSMIAVKINQPTLGLKNAEKVISIAEKLMPNKNLTLTPLEWSKAHYRKGQALLSLQQYEKALIDFEAAQSYNDQEDKAIANCIVYAKKAVEKEKLKEKQFYGKMFA